MNKYDKQHLRNLQRYEAMITALFDAAAKDAAKLSSLINGIGDAPFSWADYPLAKAKIDDIVEQLNSEVFGAVVNGVRSEWSLSNSKNNFLVQTVLGSNADSLPEAVARRYFNNNETAREAFLLRKESGLGLSDNVWRYTNQFKSEIEMALDIGIRSGKSADEISRDVRDYLKYPDKLFRRVRDEHGQLHLSQRASDFHPGRGVYRSSYMNARRLAATETNIAYRTADHLRWQELDFVVGIEIHLSNNHNCKGVPAGTYFDICDELQGRYPKDFKFTGWHPHCRCWVETILKTEAEMAEDNARIMAGEDVSESSENAVDALPSNFTAWRENNAERIERAKNLPYFLRDNQALIDGQRLTDKSDILRRAEERHAARTPRQIATIQQNWDNRRIDSLRNLIAGEGSLNLSYGDQLLKDYFRVASLGHEEFVKEFPALKKSITEAWEKERKEVEKIQKQLGIKRGKPSSWAQAMLKLEKKNASRSEFVMSKETLTLRGKTKECNVALTRGGIRLEKPTSARSQCYTFADFTAPLASLPAELRGTITHIDLVDWYNPDDAHWRKTYKNFSRSWATGGNGRITFYRNDKTSAADNDLLYTLSHESGHNLDRKYGGTGWFSDGKMWQDAVAADKKISSKDAVTTYGENSPHEDFADACMLYVTNPSKLKKEFPNRYKIIRACLHRY